MSELTVAQVDEALRLAGKAQKENTALPPYRAIPQRRAIKDDPTPAMPATVLDGENHDLLELAWRSGDERGNAVVAYFAEAANILPALAADWLEMRRLLLSIAEDYDHTEYPSLRDRILAAIGQEGRANA